MTDSSTTRDPLEGFISLVSGPIAAVIRSFDQLRKGADELLKGLENFNRTMVSLNETAERVNALLNEFEEPVRTALPQAIHTVKVADDLATRLSAPVDEVIPALARLADTLSSPVFATLPADLTSIVDAMNDLIRRVAPLGQIAESAGGLFGLRIPGMSKSQGPDAADAEAVPPSPESTAESE